MYQARVALFEANRSAESCMNKCTATFKTLVAKYKKLEAEHEALKADRKSQTEDTAQVAELLKRVAEVQVDHQHQDELHSGERRHRKIKDHSDGKDESQSGSRDRQTMPRDVRTKVAGCYEEQHTDEKAKGDMSRGLEKRKEEKYKDDRSKAHDRYKNNKYIDDRQKEEERRGDERYKEESSRHEDRHRDGKYREERSREDRHNKDERYKEKPRNERSDNSSRERHRDDSYRNHRNQDGGSWDVRSSKDNTRDRSLEKHYKEEHSYSENRYNKNILYENEGNPSVADLRSSKYRDNNKGEKRSYEESALNGDRETHNAKEYHGDATKRRSEVGSEDLRREYEKFDSRKRDFERKSSTRSSTYPAKEQSRHCTKQEEPSPGEYGAALGRHRHASDFQSVEDQNKLDANCNELSLPSQNDGSLRSDGRSVHFSERLPSASDQQVLIRSNLRHSHDTSDGSMKKGNTRHNDLLLNRQATENYQTASPGHLHPPPDRSEMDSQIEFDDDNWSQIRERRSSSRSRRSGTVDNARGHGNTWNNPSSWSSPIPNGFGPFHHGPQIPGFHPAMHHFHQSLYGIRPSMETNHTGVPYPMHGHPESFSHCAQSFQWHNPAEDPYLSQLPGWDASRSVFEEHSHSYDRHELVRNKDPDFQQQSEVPPLSHTSDKPILTQFPGQNRSESAEVKTVDETNAEKTDAHAPKYRSNSKPVPSSVEVGSRFCSNYFKRLHISTSLASPELYKQCVTMTMELEPSASCKATMKRSLKSSKDEHGYQAHGFKHIMQSIFSGKTTSIFEKAMALYSSSAGSVKSKSPASSSQPESEEVIKGPSVDMVDEGHVTVSEVQALPCTGMSDEVHNNNPAHHGTDFGMSGDSGLAKDCSNIEEDNVTSDTGDKSFISNHLEGRACYTEEQVPNNGEGGLLPDAKALQPCCNSVGGITDVPKEQFSGVISDAAFASCPQACEGAIPDCSFNLNRIPCSPGST
ncbi:uncharacterized protein LOC100828979 isoform X3 [Brachypodium distachyon]|uniref:uncharacterized protein LOC100828979 isoform X3 n=2 Tax=Brachypodium distachyon TaxID=15368 RepID=UPI000D0DDDC7|nr:uncharacterized protein LOC100828979 isoform X3 [Brachypodium distachyon]|eukprot:XP_024315431.1 uncharacterized protein LOC100828979 isoform X3 [Brachypodium distachyon]